jgi:serine/threonine protein kinase
MTGIDVGSDYIPAHIRAWAGERLSLLERLVCELLRTGAWPDLSELTRALAGEGQPQDLRGIFWSMPKPLGWIDHNPERVVLTIFGLRLTGAGRPLLEGLVRVLRLAVDRYPKGGDEATVRRSDLPTLIDEELVGVLSGVLYGGTPFLSFQGDPASDWTASIDASVVRYWNAETVDDYLRIRADELGQSPQWGWGVPSVGGELVDPIDEVESEVLPAQVSAAAAGPALEVGVVGGEREWQLGDRLGKGGFGQVHLARSGETEAVVKLVPKDPGASRELLFADLGGVPNVVPVWDQGEYGGYWFLVMPRAARSLRDAMEQDGRFSVADSVAVLGDVADALAALDGRVVHRDLKPENVLELDGHWCLADFGIARYTEATTDAETRKLAMSPPYAAPERFRMDRATAAADIYSLGVMGFELLAGHLPFQGATWEDFQEAHLEQEPPELAGVPAALAALITECLYKSPGARPGAANLRARLDRVAQPPVSAGLSRLSEANAGEARRLGQAQSQEAAVLSAEERRQRLRGDAQRSLERISDEMVDRLTEVASTVQVHRDPDRRNCWLNVGQARLAISPAEAPTAPSLGPGLFDLVAVAEIGVRMPTDQMGFSGRTHSLWFADVQSEGEYAWFETGFSLMALMSALPDPDPFALPGGQDAALALQVGMHTHVVAWPFTPLRLGELDDFIGRWAGWLADGAEGRLRREPSDGARAQGSWRRS